jgi:hypothetical protein
VSGEKHNAERDAAARTRDEVGAAARALISAANDAAAARYAHEWAVAHPRQVPTDEMYRVAQRRRATDEAAGQALESYISRAQRMVNSDAGQPRP